MINNYVSPQARINLHFKVGHVYKNTNSGNVYFCISTGISFLAKVETGEAAKACNFSECDFEDITDSVELRNKK